MGLGLRATSKMRKRLVQKFVLSSILTTTIAVLGIPVSTVGGDNPQSGVAYDTLLFHVLKEENGPKDCAGSHTLFLRHFNGFCRKKCF